MRPYLPKISVMCRSPSQSTVAERPSLATPSMFTSPEWNPKPASKAQCVSNSTTLSQLRAGSSFLEPFGFPGSIALSPSPTSFSFNNYPGSVDDPIDLDDVDDVSLFRCANAVQRSSSTEFHLSLSELEQGEAESSSLKRDDEEDTVDLTNEGMINLKDQKRGMRRFSMGDNEVIELDDWKDLTRECDLPPGTEVICLEDVFNEDQISRSTKKDIKPLNFERRNPSISAPYSVRGSFMYNRMDLKANKTVELADGGFLRIKDIVINTLTEEVKLRGHRLNRTRHLNGLLGFKVNETVLFVEIDLDDPREPLEQGAIEILLKDVVKLRRARLTNQRFPHCRALAVGRYQNVLEAADLGELTVRWKYTCKYASAADRYQNIFKERTLERIRPEECLPIYAVSDKSRRYGWRGETHRGGSYQPMTRGEEFYKLPTEEELINIESSEVSKRKLTGEVEERHGISSKRVRYVETGQFEDTRRRISDISLQQPAADTNAVIDLTHFDTDKGVALDPQQSVERASSIILKVVDLTNSDLSSPPPLGSIHYIPSKPPSPIHRTANQAYTYGDAFCGAGGSTRGALQAGLRPRWGFDFSPHACSSWRANFPSAKCYNIEAHSFVSHASCPAIIDAFKVDILHLSPPCQYFSPAHTVDGVDDEQNVASLFAVEEVIKVARPRVVTLEQTFGIACSRFKWYFNSLIQMFTSQDFSVRWAIVPLAQWGLPQRRNRLIIIASCPGENLPRMPLSTHSSKDASLLPLVSVSSTLRSIPSNAADHNPTSPSLVFAAHKQMPAWDDSKILPRAMTTSGGQNYHPSGKRDLTLREYACLQGFPLNHIFRGNYVKKQIGNAVPPCVAKVLFESIRWDLESVDNVIAGIEVID